MEALDHAYKDLIMRYSGSYHYPERLMYKMFNLLVLDNGCPWESADIGNGVTLKQMEFPATPLCDLFLSAPTTIVYQLHQHLKDPRLTF